MRETGRKVHGSFLGFLASVTGMKMPLREGVSHQLSDGTEHSGCHSGIPGQQAPR